MDGRLDMVYMVNLNSKGKGKDIGIHNELRTLESDGEVLFWFGQIPYNVDFLGARVVLGIWLWLLGNE
jgi:hypothetical protein